MRLRSALLLTLGANLLVMMTRMIISLNGAGAFLRFTSGVLIEALVTLAAFGGGAYLGLCVLDGDHRKMIPRRNLSQAQILWLAMLGVTLVFPVTLLSDLYWYLFGVGRPAEGMALSAFVNSGADFLPRLIKSALLVPVLEEVFFRGYLHGTLKRYGEKAAMLAASLCFALVHSSSLTSMDGSLLLYTLIGMLLTLVMNRTGSITAAMLVHGCYNLALILCDYSGLDILFYGLSFVNSAVRIAGCAAFVYAMKRAWLARPAKPHESVSFGKLKRREKALLAAACVSVVIAVLLLTIMGVA